MCAEASLVRGVLEGEADVRGGGGGGVRSSIPRGDCGLLFRNPLFSVTLYLGHDPTGRSTPVLPTAGCSSTQTDHS